MEYACDYLHVVSDFWIFSNSLTSYILDFWDDFSSGSVFRNLLNSLDVFNLIDGLISCSVFWLVDNLLSSYVLNVVNCVIFWFIDGLITDFWNQLSSSSIFWLVNSLVSGDILNVWDNFCSSSELWLVDCLVSGDVLHIVDYFGPCSVFWFHHSGVSGDELRLVDGGVSDSFFVFVNGLISGSVLWLNDGLVSGSPFGLVHDLRPCSVLDFWDDVGHVLDLVDGLVRSHWSRNPLGDDLDSLNVLRDVDGLVLSSALDFWDDFSSLDGGVVDDGGVVGSSLDLGHGLVADSSLDFGDGCEGLVFSKCGRVSSDVGGWSGSVCNWLCSGDAWLDSDSADGIGGFYWSCSCCFPCRSGCSLCGCWDCFRRSCFGFWCSCCSYLSFCAASGGDFESDCLFKILLYLLFFITIF